MITQLVLWFCVFAIMYGGSSGMGYGDWITSMCIMIVSFQLSELINIIKQPKERIK